MKTVKLIILMVLLSILFASQVFAFKQEDLKKLKWTNKCEKCNCGDSCECTNCECKKEES